MTEPQTTIEKLTIWYCKKCKWQSEPETFGACVSKCPNCQRVPLHYVNFDPATENDAAQKLIDSGKDLP